MFRDRLRTALIIDWLVVSALILPVLLAPFLLSAGTIGALEPVCQWKARYHRECPLCGMTTAFILISNGKLAEAQGRNRASVPLHAAFLLNECAGICLVVLQLRRKPADRLWTATVQTLTEEFSCSS